MTPQKDWLSTTEMSALTGASLRQLQWWDERGVLSPEFGIVRHGHGQGSSQRSYSLAQVETIRRMMLLRKHGVSLQRLRRLAQVPEWSKVVSARGAGYVVVGDTLVVFRRPKGKT